MCTQSDERIHEAEAVEPSPAEALGERVRAFLRGELMLADLCELTREELYILAEQGRRLYQEGLLDEARRVFGALTVLEPGEGYFLSCLGLVHQQQGELDGARRAYDQAIELDETDVPSRCNRAEVLLQLGHLEAASEDLKRIAELDPEGNLEHSQRARGMALALGMLVHRSLEEAG
ncbi:MAG TPA: tetratricopeptide repeat protein [Myxococcaceae bacterium]|nr:tetratricopeptide repeat protein [Myxococcaceae bacterium]